MAELHVSGVTKQYQSGSETVRVLGGVRMDAFDGDTVAIVGPSGSGKSTLLNIIGSLEKPDSGSVVCDGVVVNELTGDALARFRSLKVGFVFQDHHLLGQLNALENVVLPTVPLRNAAEVTAKAMGLLARMGIEEKSRSYPATLSGGERQRVAVARAMINDPGLLLCDEPTGSLDADAGWAIISLLVELARERNVTVIVVTHNTQQADRLSRKLRLENGVLVDLSA